MKCHLMLAIFFLFFLLTDMAVSRKTGHVQLPRADAIWSRLIDTFSLIEHLQGLTQAVPRHTIQELLGQQPVYSPHHI